MLHKSGRVTERAQLWFGPAPAGHKAEREASLFPPVLSHPHHLFHPVHATPVADYPVESGRHLHDAWKDGGRGSGSHLMRAFAGSKPLQPASFPARGPYLRRWVSDGCTKQDRQPEYPPSHRLGPKLRRTRLRLCQP